MNTEERFQDLKKMMSKTQPSLSSDDVILKIPSIQFWQYLKHAFKYGIQSRPFLDDVDGGPEYKSSDLPKDTGVFKVTNLHE